MDVLASRDGKPENHGRLAAARTTLRLHGCSRQIIIVNTATCAIQRGRSSRTRLPVSSAKRRVSTSFQPISHKMACIATP
jgi:hypothetical protein